ncbi:hypothetical protein BESB_034860 [Besnoitia besnoiti]|uniref:Uncharacterized protein n=1 Tax=Besnoitia besnoiti TaxID=94643 RepID=A0A2A9MET4_BESBE|nr:hypothetical protein BESB_034860 [Besnoitia besnoiti]PFH37028.1 hypothetical protein BESB_034860 [Besnoitia besnoiti]
MFGASVSRPVAGASPPPAEASSAGERSLSPDSSSSGCSSSCPPSPLPRTHAEKLRSLSLVFSVSLKPTLAASRLTSPFLASPLALPDDATNTLAVAPSGDLLFVAATEGRVQVLPLTPLGTPQSRLHRKSAASAKTQGHAPPPRRRRGREDVAGTFEEQWSLCGATPLDEERQWCRQEAAAAREGEWESLSSPASEEGAAASSADLAESGAASGAGVEGLLGVADSSACSPEPETAFLPERFTLLVPSARFRKPGALTRQPGDDEEYEGEDADVEGASSARNRRAVRVTNLSCEILAGEEVLVLTTRGGDVMVFSLKALRARLDEERRSRRDRRGRESVAVDKGGARGDTRPADERPRSLGEAPAARSESFASSASFSSWGEDAELAASLRAMQRAERRREEEEERRIKLWREQERRHTPVPDVWIVNNLGPPTLHSSCQMDVSTWSFACNPFPPTASPRSPSMQPGAWSPRLPLLPFFSSLAFGSNTHHLSFVDLRHLPVGRGSPALPLALGAETPTGPSATAALLPRGVSRRHAQRLIRAAAARLALEGPSTAATSASPAVSSSGSRSPSAARAEDVFSGRCERKLSRDEAGDAARKKRRRGRESRGAEERQEVRQEVRARELPAELRCLRMLCRDVAWAALAAGEEHFASTAEDASEAEDCDAEAASSLRGESDATRAPRSREAQRSSRRRARDGERLLPASRRRSRRSRAPRMGAWSPELQSSSFSSPHLSPASSASPLSPCSRGEAASELRREARDCCRFAPSFLPFPDPNRHVALPDAALFAELYVRPQWLRKRRRGRGDLPCAPLQGLRPSPDAASPRSGFGGGRAAGRGDPEAPARGRWGRRAEAFRRDPSAREPREVEGDAREMRRAALASRAHVLRRTLPAQQAAEEERAILRRRRALRRRLFRLDNGADGEDGEDGEGVAGAEAGAAGPRAARLHTDPHVPAAATDFSHRLSRGSDPGPGGARLERAGWRGAWKPHPRLGRSWDRAAARISASRKACGARLSPRRGTAGRVGEVSGDEREEADAADGGRAASEGGSTGDRRETPQAEARHPQEALAGEAPQALPQPQPPSSHLPPLSGQGAPLPVASQEVAPASGFLPRSGHGPAASSPSLSAGRNASASPRPSIPGSGFVSPLPLSSASFASLDSSASDARPRSPSSAPASPVSPVPLTEAAGRPPPPPEGDAGGDTEAAAARAMERAPLREASDSRAEEEEEAEDASGSDEGASARRREEDLEIRRVLEVLRAMRFPEAFVSEALTVVRERSSAADGRALAAFESRGADRGGRPEGARGSLFGRPERRLVRGVARQSAARWNAHDALTPSEHP